MQVGVTGGIGAGKSVVCKIFNILGIPVYDADSKARQLMEESPDLRARIKSKFGVDSYFESGPLNRKYLANLVFSDSQRIMDLNSLVHPEVAKDYDNWVLNNSRNAPYLIKEAALLIESGSYKQLDYLLTVAAPTDLRISRVLRRDPHRTSEQIESIIKTQLSDEERAIKSDIVVQNDEQQLLIPQVLGLHHRFISRVS